MAESIENKLKQITEYAGPDTIQNLMLMMKVEIREAIIGVIAAEFYVDDEGYLTYNENGPYKFGISNDGYLEWEVNKK